MSTQAAVGATGAGPSRRALVIFWAGVGVTVLLVLAQAASASRSGANVTLGAITFLLVLYAWRRPLLAWPTLLGLILLVILFLPIRRYTVGGLPPTLEPYRLIIALVLAGWGLALLVDPATRFRGTGFDLPVVAFWLVAAISLVLNTDRMLYASSAVFKAISILLSFFLFTYFVTSVIRTRKQLDRMTMLLVGGGAVVSLFAMIEWRTGHNSFNDLQRYLPMLHLDMSSIDDSSLQRGGRQRAYASAEHPIALSAALVLLMPMAIYLYRRRGELVWLAAAAILTMGALSTTSRTSALMLFVELLVFLWLKRKATVRLLPMLLPLFVVIQVVMPGTLGTFRAIIFPEDGIVAEQSTERGEGTGRVGDLAPSLEEYVKKPWFGQGLRTRIPTERAGVEPNARILDDEWLGVLLEVGAIGAVCLLWVFVRAVRRLGVIARRDDEDIGWLAAALAAGLAAFAAGMISYDALSFAQVTFLVFVLLGMAAVVIGMGAGAQDPPRRSVV
jgi:polysaccharide biosynthesis protein PslJ